MTDLPARNSTAACPSSPTPKTVLKTSQNPQSALEIAHKTHTRVPVPDSLKYEIVSHFKPRDHHVVPNRMSITRLDQGTCIEFTFLDGFPKS